MEKLDLSRNGLKGRLPPELGNLVAVRDLWFINNSLTGALPPELGNLSTLRTLQLQGNGITGRLPPELGNLASLETLEMARNSVTGALPPELGDLPNLKALILSYNNLTGALPPELGDLSSLEILLLNDNGLTGPIPRELGGLSSLTNMHLYSNSLHGALPPELGKLTELEEMSLHGNDLEGAIPAEFGNLENLRILNVSRNAKMSGALPVSMTKLDLDVLLAGGTDLCAPRDSVFVDWINEIGRRDIRFCTEAMAYLTQAVQSRTYSVPLVADEKALLRVFVTAAKKTSEGIPLVRARFFLDGEEDTLDIPGKSTPIPTEVDEGDLSKSANVLVPVRLVRPGLEMVIEIDPDDELDEDLDVPKRIPETGRMAVDVRDMPDLELTVVPFLWTEDPDSAILDIAAEMEEDPEDHELLWDTRVLLPVSGLDVEAHEAVESSSNDSWDLLSETEAIRKVEGGTGHWMGTMSGDGTGPSGIAYAPGWVLFSVPKVRTIAHELGHNMSLYHAPCGGAGGPDPAYPESDGSIGAYGYDFRDGGSVVPKSHRDLMSYCAPTWISYYHFTKAVGHRLSDPQEHRLPTTARSLLLWGGATPEGDLVLNPAIVVDAPAALPEAGGDHRITGLTVDSTEIFSLYFEMPELSEGGSAFAFVLPLQPGWTDSVAIITLTGPDGEATLTMETDRPVAIVRDARTGQVRAFLRGDSAVDARDGPSAYRGMVVRFSRGIPWSGEERR